MNAAKSVEGVFLSHFLFYFFLSCLTRKSLLKGEARIYHFNSMTFAGPGSTLLLGGWMLSPPVR